MTPALAFSGLVLLGLAGSPRPMGADSYCIEMLTDCSFTRSCYECRCDPNGQERCRRYLYEEYWFCH
jgi:hypothetical protein